MEDSLTFSLIAYDGTEIVCEVLFTFEDNVTHKEYIAYTDNTLDDEGNTKVYASILSDESPHLLPIETESEWEMIDGILASLQEEAL